MGNVGEIIRYILQSEKLVVVTTVLFIAGLVLYLGEQGAIFQLDEMARWARQLAFVVWVIASVHVAVRLVMVVPSLVLLAAKFVSAIPYRIRKRIADRQVIDHLCRTNGLPREMLSYARFRGDNHIWTDGSEFGWLNSLKEAGIVELRDAGFRTAHYKIHPVAWSYMEAHPNQFIHLLGWRNPPWTERFNEAQAERQIAERQ